MVGVMAYAWGSQSHQAHLRGASRLNNYQIKFPACQVDAHEIAGLAASLHFGSRDGVMKLMSNSSRHIGWSMCLQKGNFCAQTHSLEL